MNKFDLLEIMDNIRTSLKRRRSDEGSSDADLFSPRNKLKSPKIPRVWITVETSNKQCFNLNDDYRIMLRNIENDEYCIQYPVCVTQFELYFRDFTLNTQSSMWYYACVNINNLSKIEYRLKSSRDIKAHCLNLNKNNNNEMKMNDSNNNDNQQKTMETSGKDLLNPINKFEIIKIERLNSQFNSKWNDTQTPNAPIKHVKFGKKHGFNVNCDFRIIAQQNDSINHKFEQICKERRKHNLTNNNNIINNFDESSSSSEEEIPTTMEYSQYLTFGYIRMLLSKNNTMIEISDFCFIILNYFNNFDLNCLGYCIPEQITRSSLFFDAAISEPYYGCVHFKDSTFYEYRVRGNFSEIPTNKDGNNRLQCMKIKERESEWKIVDFNKNHNNNKSNGFDRSKEYRVRLIKNGGYVYVSFVTKNALYFDVSFQGINCGVIRYDKLKSNIWYYCDIKSIATNDPKKSEKHNSQDYDYYCIEEKVYNLEY